tara:strand:- start:15855 stop:16973 length:1119 start_codon:yes stop_codon:yes gene_type:complete
MTRPNIIFILLDGSRFDRIHISKEFSELLSHGTLLNNVSTAIPYTFGALNVILTGKYGRENGVDGYYQVSKLKDDVSFMPEILQENGYITARGLINDKILSPRGFDIRKEFNEYEEDLNIKHPELIKQVVSSSEDKPFFIFLQYTRIHTVTVTKVLKKYEWDDNEFYDNTDSNLKIYDDVFTETGIYAKKIRDTIDELGISENTILVFFADHGTGVGERFGERNYGSFTYDETIRTFYHFIGKGITKNRTSESLLSTIDIFPTILDLCEIEYHEKCIGKSFAEFLKDEKSEIHDRDFTFSETGALHGPYPSPETSNVFCIKSPNHKLIFLKDADEWYLYDLKNDPHEIENLYGKGMSEEKILKEKLLIWINR